MRTVLGRILAGLGGFLLLVGILGLLWAPGQVKRTPLDIDSVTEYSGTGGRVDPSTGELTTGPVLVTTFTKADSEASDGDVVVFSSSQCVVKDEDDAPKCVDGDDARLIQASETAFATDRKSAEAVENGDYVPDGYDQPEGLINKWPFDAKKKTYPYWDGTLGESVDAVYDREESVSGVKAYVYKVVVDEEPIEVAEGVSGTYSSSKEIFVEPVTGSVIKATDDQERVLDNGTKALELKISFTEDEQKAAADDAAKSKRLLTLLTKVVPIVGILGGLLAIVAGVLLSRPRRSEDSGADDVYADTSSSN